MVSLLDLLNARRSIPARLLGEPGPNDEQLRKLIEAAIRAPDHGKLVPWRLLLIRGANRHGLSELLVATHQRKEPDLSPAALEKDRERFNFAPIVIAVIARVTFDHKIPEQEQLLSGGCVAYNLLLGAQALGFGAQWLTGWAAYDRDIAAALHLSNQERILGFVHIGTAREQAPERLRPALSEVLSEWQSEPRS